MTDFESCWSIKLKKSNDILLNEITDFRQEILPDLNCVPADDGKI